MDGLSIALSPVQLAAILSGHAVSEGETVANRLWAGLSMLAGSLEMVGAAALLLAPDPTLLSKVGGVALAAHGSDTLSSGFWQAWTGKAEQTLTERAAAALAVRLGADPREAGTIGVAVDIAVPVGVSAACAAVRLASVRWGRIALLEHEGLSGSRGGGHTIARHIGKTEAELRSRLAEELRAPAASSFDSLRVAERTIYRALRANRGAIEGWARHAAPGVKQEFYFISAEPIGTVVLRSTNLAQRTTKVRVVLKMQSWGARLYYVLTAFPEP